MENLMKVVPIFALFTAGFVKTDFQSVNCDFDTFEDKYRCVVNSANIVNGEASLEFVNIHLDGKNDNDVLVLRASTTFVGSFKVLHKELLQKFPKLQVIELQMLEMIELSPNSLDTCDELIKLDLYFNHLENLPDKYFIKCKNLKVLILSKNFIKIITDDSFHGLDKLEVLDLNSNFIHTLSENCFKNLVNLKELHIAKPWQLNTYESNIFQELKSLKVINLSDWLIGFEEFQNLIGSLSILEEIDASANYFGDVNFKFFEQFKELNTLILSTNQISNISENSFTNLTNLRELSLQMNSLTSISDETFKGLENLESLLLRFNKIRNISGNSFVELKSLKELDISENNIEFLEQEVFKNQDKLIDLNLSFNEINSFPEELFNNLDKLERLIFDFNNIRKLTSNSFKYHKFLTYISGTYNRIEEIDRNFFENFPNLTKCYIDSNVCIDQNFEDFKETDVSLVFGSCFAGPSSTTTSSYTTVISTTPENNATNLKISIMLMILATNFFYFMY